MDFSENYLQKIIEHSIKLKSRNMPLLSWDIHLQNLAVSKKYYQDLEYLKKLTKTSEIDADVLNEYVANDLVIVVTDRNLNIEFASCNMVYMNGYQPSEVIGKTPKIFQGAKTDTKISKSIRQKVANSQGFEYTLTNYRKDNSIYNCHIKGLPVYDSKGNLTKYVALEKEVA